MKKFWLGMIAGALGAAVAVFAQPALNAPASAQESQTQPETSDVHLRGVLEIAVNGHPQVFVFVLSNGDIRSVSFVECASIAGCHGLVDELQAHKMLALINLKNSEKT